MSVGPAVGFPSGSPAANLMGTALYFLQEFAENFPARGPRANLGAGPAVTYSSQPLPPEVPMPRWLLVLVGLLALAFGLGCLNYTKADGLDHHLEVAAKHGLPPPGPGILYLGVASVAVGSGSVGFAFGRGKRG